MDKKEIILERLKDVLDKEERKLADTNEYMEYVGEQITYFQNKMAETIEAQQGSITYIEYLRHEIREYLKHEIKELEEN